MYDNTCFYVLTLMTRVVNTVIKTMYLHLFVFAKNGKSLVTSNALVRATEHMFGFSLKHLLQIEQTIFHAQIVVDNETVQKETATYQLSMIVYLLDIINPNHSFVERFKDLLSRYPSIDVRAMGFPAGWENEDIWK